jgi:hypothetical protein
MRRPTISLCMMVRKPAARVRAILELFRPVVDEIVLAADRTGDPATLATCVDLVDQPFAVDPAPFERWVGWLHSRCESDWILRFDDDEAPSAGLLDGLRTLAEERHPMQIAFSRRWLWGDERRWISTWPWTPDYQVRLVRNVPGAWRFPGRMHEPIETLGELRLVDAPIYHCELLLTDAQARRAKRERYEKLRPAYWNADFPVNGYYTPEDWQDVETSQTPSDDLRLIEQLRLGARPPEQPRGVDPAPAVSEFEAEFYLGARKLSEQAYSASLELVRPPRSLPSGVLREHEVVVTNLGDGPWPWGDYPPYVRLGYRWLEPGGDVVLEDRCLFTETVLPAMTTRLLAPIRVPAAGSYVLSLDVVHEHERWFGCAADYAVEVRESSDSLQASSVPVARSV